MNPSPGDRCAVRAELRGDPLIGTAFPAARVLLIEQPGPWGRRGLRDSRFPPTVADAIHARAESNGIRVQVIRRLGRVNDDGPRRWGLADTRPDTESMIWRSFTDPAELTDLSWRLSGDGLDVAVGDAAIAEPETEPTYLVCAHSRHDVCCALRGRPVAAALAQQRPGQVWETSHLGGDRFAANVLVLPSGLMYGRVLPLAVPELIRAVEADDVLVPLLRGQVGRSPAVQAAFGHVYQTLALRRRSDLRVIASTTLRSGDRAGTSVVSVTLEDPTGPLSVSVESVRVPAPGLTCANPGQNQYVQYRAFDLARG